MCTVFIFCPWFWNRLYNKLIYTSDITLKPLTADGLAISGQGVGDIKQQVNCHFLKLICWKQE